MSAILTIAKRELMAFFDSLTGYMLFVAFFGFVGFFTWLGGNGDVFYRGQASMQAFFSVAYWVLFFFIPAITMGMFAEEQKTGTIELLLTKAVTDWQVVLGKFLACLGLVAILLAFSLPYYFSIARMGNIDHGAVLCGYLGLVLMSCVYIAIGLFCSSISNNQFLSLLMALLIGVFFLILFNAFSEQLSGSAARFFNYLSLNTHFHSISRGVLDLKNVVYFLSITLLGLLLTESMLSRRHIS